jgi:plasmid stabilization system protein ParE
VPFRIRYTAQARQDLRRLYQFLTDRAITNEGLETAASALAALTDAANELSTSPFIYRKADSSPFLRELIVPFGSSGYVLLFEIENAKTVSILAIRHQMEDDFH